MGLDGYALTNMDGAVQACVRLMEVDNNWKPIAFKDSILPTNLKAEICVLHFKGELICRQCT